MNKDNLLFATIGLLLGFIAGYLMHEMMVARQPLRRLAGETGAVTPGPPQETAPVDSAVAPDPAAPAEAAPPAAGASPADAAVSGATAPSAPSGSGAPAAVAGPPAMAAVQQLRDYVASHPKDADAVLKLANLNFDIHNWGRARDLYSQYLALREPDPDVLTDLGNCLRELRQFDGALQQFRRAEQLAPAHWKSLFSEVVVLAFDLNQYDAAEKALARLQAIAPGQPEVIRLASEVRQRRSAAR